MAARFTSYERILEREGRVVRQPLTNRLVHWAIAISIFSLFFTGFGQLPLYKRYMLADLPGLGWTANFIVTVAIHYLGAAVLIFAASFHVVYHTIRRETGLWPRRGDIRESARIIKAMLTGGKEPPAEKYLAEQRLAYAFIAANVLLLVVTGFFKMADNLPGLGLPEQVGWVMTQLHNLSTMLLLVGIVGHLVAFVIPANRKLLGAMFHGKVDLAYAEHRHCLWCDRLRSLHGRENGQ